ncbi:MAG TPA: hypothetical protein VG326_16330 [Tepidisphaeraceae bacterium]|jgi:hypothetical protein|nr:hypothetical protein [Tepidisphaeraceae bacterium]
MFYLGGSEFPTTTEQLIASVTQGAARLFTLASSGGAMKIEGGSYPSFSLVTIDLTGARAVDRLPPEPKGVGPSQPGVFADRLEVAAHPLYIRQAAVQLDLTAASARFVYDRDASGSPILSLADAQDGRMTIAIQKPELDALVLSGAKEAASKQGVQILEMSLGLTQIDPRALAVEVRAKVKKLFVTTTLTLRGKLKVDDNLNAGVSDLTVSGDGMMGDMAAAAIRPKFQEIDGRSFPLTALSLGQVRLRNLEVQAGDVVKVTAEFGS